MSTHAWKRSSFAFEAVEVGQRSEHHLVRAAGRVDGASGAEVGRDRTHDTVVQGAQAIRLAAASAVEQPGELALAGLLW